MEETPYFTLYLLYLSAFLLAYIVLDVYLKAEIYTFAKKVHGPKAYPIIGSNYIFHTKERNYLRTLFNTFDQYKLPVSLWNGNQYEYWTSNVEEIEDILNSNKTLDKGNGYSKLALYLGDSLLVVSDKSWESHRKLLSKCFEPDVLEKFISVFYDRSSDLADSIAHVDQNPTQLILRCTANMFFGEKYALMLMKTMLATVVRRYTITSDYLSADEINLNPDLLYTNDKICNFIPRKSVVNEE
ncbi:unnamed protein product [Acanthoscelides obtectus]|uniref:Cytochrome P450 n=1 Tax=Acanthoscelides obtectus TaxID=200917 RepID=A0A9P0M254_ACAOB|nr:unnamed protein product [Acanthoscelides obtectus]CAK1674663.1 Cytochrome P450 4g15 [Acanthoscelides obtectus]